MNISWLIGGLILGAGSSLHCIGMCGPLVVAVPFGSSKRQQDISLIVYLLSKAIGYGIIGMVFALLGTASSFIIGQRILSVLSGILILGILFSKYLHPNYIFTQGISRKLNTLIQYLKFNGSWYHYTTMGLFNSMLPCTMVLVAASASLASGSIRDGFIFMLCFGLGTMPALFMVKKFQSSVSMKARINLKYAASVVGVLLSGMLVFRGISSHSGSHTAENKVSICKPILEK